MALSGRQLRRNRAHYRNELGAAFGAMNEGGLSDVELDDDDLVLLDDDAEMDLLDNGPAPNNDLPPRELTPDNGPPPHEPAPNNNLAPDDGLAALDNPVPREAEVDLEDEFGDWELANEADMDFEANDPAPLLPPDLPVALGVHRNPPVEIDQWFGEEWLRQEGPGEEEDEEDEEDEEELAEPEELGLDYLDLDELDGLDAMDGLAELALSDADNESVGGEDRDLEFHEQVEDGPLGLDLDNEREMDDDEVRLFFQEHFGDLAQDEWLDIYNRHVTEIDRKTLRFLSVRLRSHGLSRDTYEDLRLYACAELGLPSDFVAWMRLKMIAKLESREYDCCIESCIAYVGKYANMDECPYCHNLRRNEAGKARRVYTYTPLIPQLQGLFQSSASVKKMRHRAGHEAFRAENPGKLEDVFDGEHYLRLRNTRVKPNDEYRYFDNPDDIALGLGTDGFSMFKRRRKGYSTAWPLILVNYNLHPSIRTRLENIICSP